MQKRGGSINSKILSLMGAPLWPYTVRNARKMTSFFWFNFLLKFALAKSLCFLQWMTEIKFLQKHWNNFGENWIFSCNYSVLAEIVRFLVFRQTCFGAETPKIAERAEIPKPTIIRSFTGSPPWSRLFGRALVLTASLVVNLSLL